MSRLNGKIAIVTGASQGMGKSHAKAFIAEGTVVHCFDYNVYVSRLKSAGIQIQTV